MHDHAKLAKIAETIIRRFFSGAIDYATWFFFPLLLLIVSGLPDHTGRGRMDVFFWVAITFWTTIWTLTIVGLAVESIHRGNA